jgi:hypothetical protein
VCLKTHSFISPPYIQKAKTVNNVTQHNHYFVAVFKAQNWKFIILTENIKAAAKQ